MCPGTVPIVDKSWFVVGGLKRGEAHKQDTSIITRRRVRNIPHRLESLSTSLQGRAIVLHDCGKLQGIGTHQAVYYGGAARIIQYVKQVCKQWARVVENHGRQPDTEGETWGCQPVMGISAGRIRRVRNCIGTRAF